MSDNLRNKQPLKPEDLYRFIENARSSFQSYKQSAASAAANAYLLWRDTQASGATKEGSQWLQEEIRKRNEQIKKNNDQVKSEKKYVEEYRTGKLSKDELVNQTGKTKEDKEEIAAEKKRLDSLSKLDEKYWESLRLVPIERRDGASIFTEIVKYVFEFDRPNHASMVNRFCLGLEWIHTKFKNEVVDNIEAIVSAIEENGGFEVVIEDQRLVRNKNDAESQDREIIANRNYNDTKGALKGANPLASVDLEARHEQDGLVIMVARYEGGKAHVVAELPAGEGEFKRLISRYENPELLPVSDTTEYIARIMELGGLVSDGEGSSVDKDSDKDAGKTERLILTNIQNAKPQLLISATNADSAVIIKSQPKEGLDLGITEEPLFLNTKLRKELEKKTASYERRRLIEFSVEHQPTQKDGKTPSEASMAWVGCNEALKAAGRSSATQKFYWYPITKLVSRPLEPNHFEPSVRFTLKREDVRTVYRGPLKAWEESKDSAKTSKLISFKNEGESLHVTINEGGSVTVGIDQAQGPNTLVRFRPREFANLFSMLSRQHGSDYQFELDDTGLLMVAWEDKFATYQVYLPTATKDGRLESRRVAPMRLSLPLAAE